MLKDPLGSAKDLQFVTRGAFAHRFACALPALRASLRFARDDRSQEAMRGTHFAEISAFVAVAEDGSFTRAAKRLGVSVATLSHSVRALEDRLGVRLLNRTTRNVAPTHAGTHMLGELQPLLSVLDGAMDSVH